MITNRPLPPPTPTPLCATYAQHLPLLHTHELKPDQVEALRNHLAECAWCQSVLATYDVVENALRRHFGPAREAPNVVTMEEIMRATDREDRRSPSDSDDDPVTTDLSTPPPRRLYQPRRLLSGLAAVAAVLLVALLAELLFVLHQPPTGRLPIISLRAVRTGRFTEYPLPIPTRIYLPGSIVAGRDGALWFTESNMGAIGRISPSGVYTEFPLPHPDSRPNGLALGPDGNFWFTDW
jgi:hypothetical protein